jgi:4-amino-4-deoxy-L-arabinose transferase-like glycosyltransferase
LLAAALAGGGILRGAEAAKKVTLISDEGITFLAATGHQGEFAHIRDVPDTPYGRWATAGDWKRFIQVEDKLCLGRIGRDIAATDIHPPLYFWLLHIWSIFFGVDIWTGPALNVLLAAASTLAVFLLGRRVLGDPLPAAAAACVWALSPTVVATSIQARQYDLLGLCTSLFIWQALRCTDMSVRHPWRQCVLLAGLTAAVLLTYYHATLIVSGCCLVLFVRLLKTNRGMLIRFYASICAGVGVFVLLHPHFLESVARAKKQSQDFSGSELTHRVEQVLTRYASFYVDVAGFGEKSRNLVAYAVVAIVVLSIVFMLVRTVKMRRTQRPSGPVPPVIAMFLLWLWAAGTNIGLYLACVSPRHAMEPKHPSMVYPLFAVLTAMILASFKRGRTAVAFGLCIAVGISGITSVSRQRRYEGGSPNPAALAAGVDTVLIDTTNRLLLPAAVVYLPDSIRVFVARQQDLLVQSDAWKDNLGDKCLYISQAGKREEVERLRRIVGLVASRYDVQTIQRRIIGGRGIMLMLTRKGSAGTRR